MNATQQTTHQSESEQETETSARTCPECGSHLLTDTIHAEIRCADCGLVVVEDTVDPGPEWRAFNHDEREAKSRVGAPLTERMHDRGLTTQISWSDTDANGRTLPSEKRRRMRRLRKWHEWTRTRQTGERNLQLALSEIDRMASALGVPKSVREVASVIYRRALTEDLIRGRSIEAVATAALYAACRDEGIPRSLDEVTGVSRVEYRDIGRAHRYVSRQLGLELKPVDPKKYVPRFCSELGVSEAVEAKANEIIEVTVEKGLLSGKSPPGYAAAAIYAASRLCDEKTIQSKIADVAQVTEVTIRKRYQEQVEAMGYATRS